MRPKSRDDFTIAIICALIVEADAVEALFDETFDRLGKYYGRQPGDANAYINGRIGQHNIVLCYLPEMGKGSAASAAASLPISYKAIQLALVVGICGGAPRSSNRDIFLGDVIISDSVVEYDLGRQYPGGFKRKTDVKDILGRPNREIRTLLVGLNATKARSEFQKEMLQHLHTIQQTDETWQHPNSAEDILYNADYHHKHHGQDLSSPQCSCVDGDSPKDICDQALEEDCDGLRCERNQIQRRRENSGATASVHIGKVASANMVMKSGEHRDQIIANEKVVAFEMEGAGVWDNISCIIIKGVCDYSDSHKSKTWQTYAAATGASAAKAFLEYWRPVQKEVVTKGHWMVPFKRNSQFVGRHEQIAKIEDMINQPNGPSKIAIFGLGGVGKTQIVLELAYRMQTAECSIFWIACTSYESVEQGFFNLARAVGMHIEKPEEAKSKVKDYLSQKSAGKWLLIFDNADDDDMWIKGSDAAPALKQFLPQSEDGHIVFTARNRQLAVKLASTAIIPVEKLDEHTGMEMLEKSLIQKEALINDREMAVNLLEELTFLPLAITQAVSYINQNDITIEEYISLLHEQEPDVVELLGEDFEDESRYENAQNPIATTWWISFQQIQDLNELAADHLFLMACINHRDIPRSLLSTPASASKKKGLEAISLLKNYSFISAQAGDDLLSLHRLVHLATRNWMRNNNMFCEYVCKASDQLNETFPVLDEIDRNPWRVYLSHSLSLIGEKEFDDNQERHIDLLQKVGDCLRIDGRYNEAEIIFSNMLVLHSRISGDTHPLTLICKKDIAIIYGNQGRMRESEQLFVQVLETSKQVFGLGHSCTMNIISNLSAVYRDQGKWQEAEQMTVQVLSMFMASYGLEHRNTLGALTSLATIYNFQGYVKDAKRLYEEVLGAYERLGAIGGLGAMACMSNLTAVYLRQEERDQHQLETAEQLALQAVEIGNIIGPKHPETLSCMHNLSEVYRHQGRFDEAEGLMVQVIETRKQTIGLKHPDTLSSMHNLALTYYGQGHHQKCEEQLIQALEARRETLGLTNPDTLSSMYNLGVLYYKQGQQAKAEEQLVQVINIRKQVLGLNHPDTLLSWELLAELYKGQYQPRSQEAAFLLREIQHKMHVQGIENHDFSKSRLHCFRREMMVVPPSSRQAPPDSTALYLVSHPLPADITSLKFVIDSRSQGFCDDPTQGFWTWFEASIIRPWCEDVDSAIDTLASSDEIKAHPEDFGSDIQERGWYFEQIPDISDAENNTECIGRRILETPLSKSWECKSVTWSKNPHPGSDELGSDFVDLLQEGDRIIVWARARFPGWVTCVREVQIMADPAEPTPSFQPEPSPQIPEPAFFMEQGGLSRSIFSNPHPLLSASKWRGPSSKGDEGSDVD